MEWSGFEVLKTYVEERLEEFSQISDPRKGELEGLAAGIRSVLKGEGSVPLIFICTHNSRRSHMSQLWAQFAAGYYGAGKVYCYSGGTEATAFNPSAVRAMVEAGFQIEPDNTVSNPKNMVSNPLYWVRFPGGGKDERVFSKKYSDPLNPFEGFIAVMTCADADNACPVVNGAFSRHPITYDDPKVYDGTPEEQEGYAERCRQIAREMLFLFSRI